jgi:uncharacterized protein YkwD
MDDSFFKKMLAWILAGGLCIVAVILLARTITERVKKPQFVPAPPTTESAGPALTVQGIIFYTNKARQEIGGLPPLSENSLLNTIASERLKDMFEKQYFAHQSPSGEAVTDVAYRTGYHYKILAENIGLGLNSDEKMVQGWLQSPGHRENIVRPECAEIGVAVGRGMMKKQQVWLGVQVFGLQSPPVEQGGMPGQRPSSPPAVVSNQSKDCLPPDDLLLASIKEIKNQLSDMDEAEKKLRQELEENKPSSSGYDPDRTREAVSTYNKKVYQYNALIRDIQLKMEQYGQVITKYNNQVANYKACLGR